MKWANTNTTKRISMAKTLVYEVKKHPILAETGLTDEKVDEMVEFIEKVEQLRREKDSLYRDWLMKTEEFDESMKILYQYFSKVKKTVKMELPRPLWKSFGFEDKR